MKGKKGKNGLTGQQETFVAAYAETHSPAFAAAQAGYAHPQVAGYAQLNRPAVLAEVRKREEARLFNDLLPKAVTFLEHVLDKGANERNRIMAAKIVLDRTLGAPEASVDKDLHEMTADELAARRARLEAASSQIEQALLAFGDRAKDVTPPENDPPGGAFG